MKYDLQKGNVFVYILISCGRASRQIQLMHAFVSLHDGLLVEFRPLSLYTWGYKIFRGHF
jgi:hypothetical protein